MCNTLSSESTVGNDNDDVLFWEVAGLLPDSQQELCVIIRADVAQFLFGVANKLSRARSQTRRTSGHALGVWNNACSMIPGNVCTESVDCVSQKYDQQTLPMEAPPEEALANESP